MKGQAAALTLFLALPSTLLAFRYIRTGHQFGIEANVEIVGAALWTPFWTPALKAYHCTTESVHDLVRRVEYERRVRPFRSIRVSEPGRQIPRGLCDGFQMSANTVVTFARSNRIGD